MLTVLPSSLPAITTGHVAPLLATPVSAVVGLAAPGDDAAVGSPDTGSGTVARVIVALVVVVLVANGLLAVLGLVETARNRPPGLLLRRAVGVVVALLAVQAVIAAVRVFGGGVRLVETSTFLIYLAVSIGVLPIALQFATASDDTVPVDEGGGPTRWGGAVVAVGAIATAVAVLRLQGLWDARA